MKDKSGCLVISLDFELYWGMTDKVTLEEYGEHITGAHTAIPQILELFREFNVHATWATVGFLMCRDNDELTRFLPTSDRQPHYNKTELSNYTYLATNPVGNSESDDQFHFGSSLVDQIIATPGQELASHTFSHFYCKDVGGESRQAFYADCAAQKKIFETYAKRPTSVVLPRNQITTEALEVLAEFDITSYRGTEHHILYRDGTESGLIKRAFRLIDAYLNITGHHTHTIKPDGVIVNIPSSRFLRPYYPTLSFLEPLKLHRIKRSMTHAAKRGEVFHLWWHPHNFGTNIEKNLEQLHEIIQHYKKLQREYGMQSLTMQEVTTHVNESNA